MAQLPATFKGSPQDLADAMLKRMKILSPNGTNFIFIGDVAPSSNVGPWLKNGTQWWVWDDTTNQYVPQDLSASTTAPFVVQNSTPTGSTSVPLWLKTTQDATDQNPSHGEPIGWFLWDGSVWAPFNSTVNSGPTTSRPANPDPFQQFYDTTINCLIWFERSAWRTVSGVVGDLKFVSAPTATAALTQNPGWTIFSPSVADNGRVLSMATQDQGPNPQTVLPVPAGVNPHSAYDTFGEAILLQTSASSTVTSPPTLALWCLVKS